MSNDDLSAARLLSFRDIGWIEAGDARIFLCAADGLLSLREELIREMGVAAQRDMFARAGSAATARLMAWAQARGLFDGGDDGLRQTLGLLTAAGYGQCVLEEARQNDGWAVIRVRHSLEGSTVRQTGAEPTLACDFLRGLLRGVVQQHSQAGDNNSECMEIACVAQGDEECRFAVGMRSELAARGYQMEDRAESSVRETLLRLNRQMEDVLAAAQRDGLTGIYNRAYFESALRSRIEFANRRTDTLAVALIDLDKFKAVNDTQGHGMGDLVLRRVATLLASQARETDVVARYGGDEFALLMPGTTVEAAMAVTERARLVVAQSLGIGNLTQTLSIGIAVCPGDANRLPELLELADLAMYRAKDEGGNRVIHYGSNRGVSESPSVETESAPVSAERPLSARPRSLPNGRRPEIVPGKRRRRSRP